MDWCNNRTSRYGTANYPLSSAPYRADNVNFFSFGNGSLGNIEAVENNGKAFAPKQCLYQKVTVGIENPKMQSPLRCNKRTWRYGSANNPLYCTTLRAENGNLGNFEPVENNSTAFAAKHSLYQKVAVGKENRKMQSPLRCNKRTGRYGSANNPLYCTALRTENGNLGNFETVENNGIVFAQ